MSASRMLLTIALISWSGVHALAQSSTPQGQPLTLEDYYRIEAAASPVISPDGQSVVYVRTRIIESENRRQSEVWLVPSDGAAQPRMIFDPQLSATNPRWNHDGTIIALQARRPSGAGSSGASESANASPVWFVSVKDPARAPYQIQGVESVPVFSPDGRWMAFTRKVRPTPERTPSETSPIDRTLAERFKGRIYEWMDYRFDQRGYLTDPRDASATPSEELFVMPTAGGEAKQLTTLSLDARAFAWRPDSSALVLVADESQRDEYTYERADLWVVTLAGQSTRLTNDGYNHSAPAWSADGRRVVFRRQKGLSLVLNDKERQGAPIDLYEMSADGGDMRNLTAQWELIPESPTWSADGQAILFEAEISGNSHLFRVSSLGGAVDQITKGDRQLGDFSWDKATSRVAYTAADVRAPAEVFVANADGGSARRLSSLNTAWLAQRRVSTAERLVSRSKDGAEVEGWVLLPPEYDAAKGPYPLILSIHGGPHGAYGNTFSFQHQLFAANGFIVLYTNPRGSTGYGEKYLWATWGGWGILDYDDVMGAVDAAVRKYPVDSARLGVTGYSYGGFLTNWVITQTARFKAAAVGAGISNWLSDYGTADIPRTKESEFFGTPWETASGELMWKLSPVAHAENVKTPTLFVHGEADLRVPIEQGEQMYMALKKRRVPAKFIRYPDSYHGGWTPWNTVHRYHQEISWWQTHLGSRPAAPTAASGGR